MKQWGKKSKGGIKGSICDTVVHFSYEKNTTTTFCPHCFLFVRWRSKSARVFFFFQTPDHQGGVHQQTKYDMHIGAKEYHVQNKETRWNAGVYTPDTLKSSRLVYMRISCSYGCRMRDAEWVNCNVHSRKRITQLLAISIAYWQRPEIDTTKTNDFHGLGLCLRFRNVQRDRVKAHWSRLCRGRYLAHYVTHLLSLLGSLRTGKSLTSSAVFRQASHHWFLSILMNDRDIFFSWPCAHTFNPVGSLFRCFFRLAE